MEDKTSVKIEEEMDPPIIMKEKKRAAVSDVRQKEMKGEVPGKEEDILIRLVAENHRNSQ